MASHAHLQNYPMFDVGYLKFDVKATYAYTQHHS